VSLRASQRPTPRRTGRPAEHRSAATDLRRPDLYINRELSLLAFYQRVLDEADEPDKPALERVKSVYYSRLDEFFMIRVSGLREQVSRGLSELPPDGMTATEQLVALRERALPLLQRQQRLLRGEVFPALAARGVRIVDIANVSPGDRAALDAYYEREVFPVLTPLAVDPGHPFPHISNLSLNLAVAIDDPKLGNRFARLKIPNVLPRFIPVPPVPPSENAATADDATPASATALTGSPSNLTLLPLEQLIAANLDDLFPGLHVVESYAFQVIRDADIEIAEDEAADLSLSIGEALSELRFGSVVCLLVEESMPDRIRRILMEHMEIGPSDVYPVNGMLALGSLAELDHLDRPDLKYVPFQPRVPAALQSGEDIFAAIARGDILLHHPYDSFAPILDLLQAAARDPNVLAIKQTLYRVGGSHAPVVDALLAAAEEGTQVAVLVELKARFDEENNIEWARALERAGAHVAYGLVGLKTHAKLLLIVRKERDGLRRYVHLGTGNYNAGTARGYTDIGLLTARPELGADVSELFNYLTGYSHQEKYRKLLVAPVSMRERLMLLLEREIAQGEKGHIVFKMNALVDSDIIATLYRASQAGVRVELLVRGVCCLRPGVAGVSERIRVTSLIGRFLEHSRIYYFANGGAEELYLGSADLMPRNLDRRVETLFPVEDATLRRRLLHILAVYRRDTVNTYILRPDGVYARVEPDGPPPFDAQAYFLTHNE
jgi:polyphosphate kinase